ncbi:transporter substrate-binding domain-containing protein [Microbulbifer hydrolyticus]|uniref:Membrane-bound lytic murein transglycosylase F n=1 Tax=Microbulbifer hydrolyticus TaxID=48074 RepID=A0A6P1T9W2_9GAMM|nr:transporter substrate-binding domain-containing protein [Microbulbifer hydrolyticus]MBB5209897.1 membrane-bound lytic murein transglycosylase F [Microbulbifer hydrolyticus]QHQ39564.1 transporter substrate-binding domain-containing protein [Microbulbifer hydrolyticus]
MGTPARPAIDRRATSGALRKPRRSPLALAACLFVALLLPGCDRQTNREETPQAPTTQGQQQERTTPTPEKNSPPRRTKSRDYDFQNYTETGDLNALKKRGTIRFIGLAADEDDMLPRSAVITQRHFDLAMKLADQLGLEPRWIQVDTPEHALTMLKEGKADILAGNLTRTEEREKNFNLSQTMITAHQVLVTGADSPSIDKISELEGRTLSTLEGSTYAKSAKALQEKIPNLTLKFFAIKKSDNPDTLLDWLNQRKGVVTILDSNIVDNALKYRQDFHKGAAIGDKEEIVWAVRKNAPELKRKLNNFFTRTLVTAPDRTRSDWKSIKKSRVLRLLTYNGPTSYFIWQGALMGFDHDLVLKFAKAHDLELQLIVVPHDENLIDWLKDGKGDIAGASSTITDERKSQGIEFTTPYLEMPEQVLSNSKKPKVESLQDLNGRTLTLRAYSSFIETAKSLKKSGIDVKIEIAAPDISYEHLINMVADGELEATIVDAGAARIQASLRDSLVPGIEVSDPRPQGWMVNTGNEKLLEKLNEFIQNYRKTDDYATKVRMYFTPDKRFSKKVAAEIQPGKDISPYDDLVKAAAEKYEIDWLFVVAQMWQESSFNPKAESPVGAQGLLQVMPRTAEEMGYPPPLFDPRRGLEAGIKYMHWLQDRFDAEVDLENKLWFSLAAYNAGIGHVYDAQRLADKLGLDRNVWFDNVEKAMLKLSEPRYFNKARYGYARGAEPVEYVRNISQLYRTYSDINSESVRTRLPQLPPPAMIALVAHKPRLQAEGLFELTRKKPLPYCRYGILQNEQKKVLRRAQDVVSGQKIHARLAEGEITASVE